MGSTIEDAAERAGDTLDENVIRAAMESALTEDARQGETKLPLAQIAGEVGIPYGTLSGWRGASYKGDNTRVTRAVQSWLATRAARKRVAVEMPDAPGFIRNPTGSRIWELLEHCQTLPDIGVIAGGAGIGKTSAVLAYQRAASNVWVATMAPVHRSPAAMNDRLGLALGLGLNGTPARIMVAIEQRLRGSGGLLVVDEAQNLNFPCLEMLRTYHDSVGIGVVMCGNETLSGRFEGQKRTAEFAQLFSRIGVRFRRAKPTAKDAIAILDAWGIEDEAVRTELTGIAMKPGAFRALTKLLRMACGMARTRGREQPTLDEVQVVWRQIGESAA